MKSSRGFTLIEMMITVIIIGILVTVALPSYQSYVRDAKRIKAASCLMEHAQFMTQIRAAHLRFDKKTDGTSVTFPSLACSQDKEIAGLYTFDFAEDEPTASTFLITASPSDGDAACATLSINQQGIRGITGSGTVDDCW